MWFIINKDVMTNTSFVKLTPKPNESDEDFIDRLDSTSWKMISNRSYSTQTECLLAPKTNERDEDFIDRLDSTSWKINSNRSE